MEIATITKLHKTFEESAYQQDGVEYWLARELQLLLGYAEWRNFFNTIDKAKESCKTSGEKVFNHFVDINKTIPMPKGAEKEVPDIMLTRYACYLIAQNGDPKKEQIAFAQSYFAIQTRKQELLEERIQLMERLQAREKLAAAETELSKNIYERGVDNKGFAIILSKGDWALFGGHNTSAMKRKLGIAENRPLADFLPTITISAKQFATEITNFNVQKNNLKGENNITTEHIKNNSDIRELLGKSGIKPEQLPAEEVIKKLERRVAAADKTIANKKLKPNADMKKNWEIKRLSEIGKVYNGNSINEKVKKDNYADLEDGFPFIATKDISYESIIDYYNGIKIPFEEKASFKTAPKNTVLICAEGGSAGRKIGFTNQEVCFGNKLFALDTNKNIESRYVYYYYFSATFQKHFAVELAGIIGGVSMNKFKDLEIPLPPLPEQQRIVAILNEAFAAIAKAKANAEQNLKNAKELFESYLQGVFENGNWETKIIEEVCDEIFAGGDAPKNNYSLEPNEKHQIPIYSNAVKDRGLYGYSDFARVTKPSISISARGSGTGHTEIRFENYLPIVRLIVLIPNLSIINLEFLKHSIDNLEILRSGSAIPQLTVPMIKEYSLPLPSLKEQDEIVQKLDALSTETKKLEAIYQQKINDLEELKKSVLQKAFSGELKTTKAVV